MMAVVIILLAAPVAFYAEEYLNRHFEVTGQLHNEFYRPPLQEAGVVLHVDDGDGVEPDEVADLVLGESERHPAGPYQLIARHRGHGSRLLLFPAERALDAEEVE